HDEVEITRQMNSDLVFIDQIWICRFEAAKDSGELRPRLVQRDGRFQSRNHVERILPVARFAVDAHRRVDIGYRPVDYRHDADHDARFTVHYQGAAEDRGIVSQPHPQQAVCDHCDAGPARPVLFYDERPTQAGADPENTKIFRGDARTRYALGLI